MPDRDTDWKPGDQAVVTLAEDTGDGWWTIKGANCGAIQAKAARPLPTPSPTAQRVVEAAVAWRATITMRSPGDEPLMAATDAARASLRPADPLAVALEALRPFADACRSGTIDDALSFSPHTDVNLTITRGFDNIEIPASAFAIARAAIPLIEAAMKGEG